MNVLVVDDHPMTVSGYIESLSSLFLTQPVNFLKAYHCEGAFHKFKDCAALDLAILDYGLPSYEFEQLYSGIDVARRLRLEHPNCKIIVITAHTEILLVYDILRASNPDGLLLKNEITSENLPLIVREILQGNYYQSPGVRKIVKEIWKKDLMVDDLNRQILIYLAKGYRIKKIEQALSLSMSAVQRRIAQMKLAFDVKEDTGLVEEAILQNFL